MLRLTILFMVILPSKVVESLLLENFLDFGDIRERELHTTTEDVSCRAQFRNCIKSYFGLFDDFQHNYTHGSPILVDRESLDFLCSDSRNFQECLQNVRFACHSDVYWGSERVHYYTSLGTYICSQGGIKALLKTHGSQCDRTVKSDRLRAQCEMDAQRTYQLEKGITDRSKQKLHCSFVKQHKECAVKAATQACGAAVAEFLAGIDHHVNAERYELERKLHGC